MYRYKLNVTRVIRTGACKYVSPDYGSSTALRTPLRPLILHGLFELELEPERTYRRNHVRARALFACVCLPIAADSGDENNSLAEITQRARE